MKMQKRRPRPPFFVRTKLKFVELSKWQKCVPKFCHCEEGIARRGNDIPLGWYLLDKQKFEKDLTMNNNLNRRWLYLVLGVVSMLFAGIIYAWSILKAPFAAFWSTPQLALNFTITMTCFCLSGFLGAKLSKRFGVLISLLCAGILSAAGFMLVATLQGSKVLMLYLSYGVLAGFGIGIAYNVVISTVNAWFPDKKGLSSGCLMMGFGASSLIIGGIASQLMEQLGWQRTFVLLGAALGIVLAVTAIVLRKPQEGTVLPAPKAKKIAVRESFEIQDRSTAQMLQLPSFWMIFIAYGLVGAVGNSVISFARDLSLSVGASAALATTLVGVLSVCNGLGRIIAGALFDATGRRVTMLVSGGLTIVASSVALGAVLLSSLPMCIAGLCLVGLSYGFCPTVSSTSVAAFYGIKYYPTNFSVMNFNLIGASFIATACSSLYVSTQGYIVPFVVLLGLSCSAMTLILLIKKP